MKRTKNNIFLSVIIPSYNEERSIYDKALEKVEKYLKDKDFNWEVLIVDDKSTDDSVKLSKKFAKRHKKFKVYEEIHRGKGGTVMAGVKKSRGGLILFTDMDQATPIREFDKFIPKFENGADVVIGSRTGRRGAPLSRKAMAYGFVLLRSLILGLPYKDTQCGFKAFTKSSAEKIFKNMNVFGSLEENPNASVTAGFDLELLYIARKLGLKIEEVKVKWDYKDTQRVSAVKDSIEALQDMLKIKFNSLMGRYDIE